MTVISDNNADPTFNVRELLGEAVHRQDDLREAEIIRANTEVKRLEAEVGRLDDKFRNSDVKYQIQFNAAKEALGIALIAQEKAVAAALEGTKEAINKADIATDKRFNLLSEKIDGVNETLNKNSGQSGLYVTQVDMNTAIDKLATRLEAALTPFNTFMNSQTAVKKSSDENWSRTALIIGATAGVVAIIGRFI